MGISNGEIIRPDDRGTDDFARVKRIATHLVPLPPWFVCDHEPAPYEEVAGFIADLRKMPGNETRSKRGQKVADNGEGGA